MLDPRFIQIKTPDGLSLPGLFFAPEKTKKAAIYLHGNGSSSVFYAHDFSLAHELNKQGISYLCFNNRGAGIIKYLTAELDGKEERKKYGMAYEKIKDCAEDIDGAIEFLKQKGYTEFYLIGLSTGANKICVYDHYRPDNPVSKYILIGGGDDTGIYYNLLGKDRFTRLLNLAKEKIKLGFGEDIICELLPDHIFSYQGFYDIADSDGDYNVFPFYEKLIHVKLSHKPLFRFFKAIKKPTLAIYGEHDEYVWGNVDQIIEILNKYRPGFTYKIVKNADHSFHDRKKELGEVICNWLISE